MAGTVLIMGEKLIPEFQPENVLLVVHCATHETVHVLVEGIALKIYYNHREEKCANQDRM